MDQTEVGHRAANKNRYIAGNCPARGEAHIMGASEALMVTNILAILGNVYHRVACRVHLILKENGGRTLKKT